MSDQADATVSLLVERARDPSASLQQQHAAFTRLVERSQHFVLALALGRLRNTAEAQDAAQDTFLTAWLRLRQLRDGAAFNGWLRTIVTTECQRRLRRRPSAAARPEPTTEADDDDRQALYQSMVAPAIATLPAGDRRVIVLFYFLGYTLQEIARLLHQKPGTVGKRLHSARLRIRRRLPPSVRGLFVRLKPSRTFVEKVRDGLFDEYLGEYRFERRPELVVQIVRQGDSLVGIGGGQRHLLASLSDQSLVTGHYDGEGRFGRDRRGKVTHFVYYEFGKRLGIARRQPPERVAATHSRAG